MIVNPTAYRTGYRSRSSECEKPIQPEATDLKLRFANVDFCRKEDECGAIRPSCLPTRVSDLAVMKAAYIPFLVGKRSTSPVTATPRLPPSDVVRLVSDDMAKDIWKFPMGKLLDQIADLQIARNRAEARIAAQNEVIAELRRSAAADGPTIHGLKSQIATLDNALMREHATAAAAAQARDEAAPTPNDPALV